jgi:ABC-type proline/glycine betaine transport system substrate-binding protein
MGKRFAIVVAVAAAGVMALGAQTAAAATYNTKVTITQDRGRRAFLSTAM